MRALGGAVQSGSALHRTRPESAWIANQGLGARYGFEIRVESKSGPQVQVLVAPSLKWARTAIEWSGQIRRFVVLWIGHLVN